jgi:hypothetical protein
MSEGLWLKDKQTLLFSDIPNNTIFLGMRLRGSGFSEASGILIRQEEGR